MACREERAVVCAAAYSRQDQAGSTEIILASAPEMIDCRRDDPMFRMRCSCLCKQKFVTRQFPSICFVNQKRAWYEAYLHYFSRLQLELDRIDIHFFPTKNYITISSKKITQQKKWRLDNTSGLNDSFRFMSASFVIRNSGVKFGWWLIFSSSPLEDEVKLGGVSKVQTSNPILPII